MKESGILIVEDEAIIAMEIENSLRHMGYRVTSVVNSSRKAIEKAREDRPDLILMDIRIKGELDGIDTAEIIRSELGIPVVFSTAYLDEERIERAKLTMPFGYVLKPIQEKDLKITIEMALHVHEIDKKRQAAEQALQESEKMYRALFEKNPNPIAIINIEGRYLEANQSFLRFVNLERDELLVKTTFDFAPPNRKKIQESEHRPAWESGATLETDYLIEGTIKTLELAITPIRFKGQEAVMGVGREIARS